MLNPDRTITAPLHVPKSLGSEAIKCVSPHCREDGFTLLEVMVAMVLLAVIMTTSVSMLFLNIKGWEGLTESSDRILENHLILARVTTLVQHLTPLVWRNQRQQRGLAFSGNAQQLHFISPAPQQHAAGGLFEYLLTQESDPEQGMSLVLYYAPLHADSETLSLPESGSRRVMITGLDEVQFSFYGRKRDRTKPEWTDSWESESQLYPKLIRMTQRHRGEPALIQDRFIRIRHQSTLMVR
ncbi:MAG: prepilin-type N-terminal cleavage/methylation domain-containing protein [Candidatus Thiodiazotropha sp. (ex Ustalcina ferruginea)]|nr:prepilin-type N-terminal cleavage/methylation domain-containing protein [Candidatus Thiodiazotropha sp. (ex Ustalcina ferruginea)]